MTLTWVVIITVWFSWSCFLSSISRYNEFDRHHRTYAALYSKGTSVAELSHVSRYYHDLINSLCALNRARDDSDSFNRKSILILMEELREDLRTLAHSLDQATIASWSDHREASETLKVSYQS